MDQTRACLAMRKRQERTLSVEVIEIEIIRLLQIIRKGTIRRLDHDREHQFRLVTLCRSYIKTHRSVDSLCNSTSACGLGRMSQNS